MPMPTENTLAGYALVDRIAKGGMAEVFKARPPADEARGTDDPEVVVLKHLLSDLHSEEAFVNLFLDEGRLCVRLNHPNVVRTYKVFKKGVDYFMVQELVDGVPLSRVLDMAQAQARPVDLAAAVHVALGLCKALEYVHQTRRDDGSGTIVHRDLNPSNVLCGKEGSVKLTDFGVAETEGQSAMAATGAIKGTLPYLSPEAVLGRPVDRRADIFAVGIILWELVANQPLFGSASDLETMHKIRAARTPLLSNVRKDTPDLLVHIVRKALFADPQIRFQTAAELHKALTVLTVRAGMGRGDQALAREVKAASTPAPKS